jgi:hypothetical protein
MKIKYLILSFSFFIITIGTFAQKELRFHQRAPVIWEKVTVQYSDSLSKALQILESYTTTLGKGKIDLSFYSKNNVKFDTTIYTKWWKKRIKFEVSKIPRIKIQDSTQIVKEFIENKTNDSTLYIFLVHARPGCMRSPIFEEVRLYKHDGKIKCLYLHFHDFDNHKDKMWHKSKNTDQEF